jgi:GTP pyrophosphokinase
MSEHDCTFKALSERIRAVGKNYDIERIKAAFELADSAHDGQKRKSGEPYIAHPIAVAHILLELCMDTDTIVAALLHDVVEDTDITLDTLRRRFGEPVADLVDGVTKIGKIKLRAPGESDDQEGVPIVLTEEEQKAENIRKILVAMSKDIRVIIIKLADRLHNMRTLDSLRPDKQRRIALETISFYAPLAHRLGIAAMKDEMENKSLFFLDEFAYREIEEVLERHKQRRDDFIGKITARIKVRLSDLRPPPVIEGRIKGIYSLYRKWYTTGKTLDEIYDVYAIRVIVDVTPDCYNVMGVIHDMFTPLPARFKDYIASPKVNGYQSLHTTVLGKEGQPFEVQIRTHDMHNTARFGVAAHWRYKLGQTGKHQNTQTKFDFIRQLLEQQQHSDDVELLAEAIKTDLSPDEVYVFTPQGEVKSLPQGATVVDFAYIVHTQVGNKMTGAKVHGKMVSYDYVLKTGDLVEIKISNSENHGPNRSWLDYAKTNGAKSKIRNWLKRERRDENIASGKAYIDSVLRRDGIRAFDEDLAEVAEKHRYDTLDDFYAAIGYGGVSLINAAMWVKDDLAAKKSPLPVDTEALVSRNIKRKQSAGVTVEGIEGCLVRYANCCNPLPGDAITGFITRGFGVAVHKTDCINMVARKIAQNDNSDERIVCVEWSSETARDYYNATIEIIAEDRTGLLADVTAAIAGNHIFIVSNNSRLLRNGNAALNYTIEIANLEQLANLMTKIKKIDKVISVERTAK